MRATILCFMATAALVSLLHAQSPTPVVVQAMTPVATTNAPATANNATSIQGALKSLQALKAANEEILKQQAETLIKLDEIEKAAQEIKIYTKRG
ncbi:MAG: hypothetical protein ACR2MF_06805 [Chthoniobacterales bacterium]